MAGALEGNVTRAPRRPRDRKAQIARAAGEQFTKRGFHAVRMDQIAEATGITVRALYRHYENKQALLTHIIVSDQERVLRALGEAMPEAEGQALEHLLIAFVTSSLESLRMGALWQRDARHLPPDDRDRIRAGTRHIAGLMDQAIGQEHPDLDPHRRELRAWATLCIVTSPGHFESGLPRRQLAQVTLDACRAAITAPPGLPATPSTEAVAPEARTDVRTPGSRREQLIAAAAKAFRTHGYEGASIDKFGSEVGIAGPALYRYFDNKADILASLINRFLGWLAHENARALTVAMTDEEVLPLLAESYLRVALEAADLHAVMATELMHLQDPAAERCRRALADDQAEWVRWLSILQPSLSKSGADVLVNIVRTMLDGLIRVPHLSREPWFIPEVMACAMAIFTQVRVPPSRRQASQKRRV